LQGTIGVQFNLRCPGNNLYEASPLDILHKKRIKTRQTPSIYKLYPFTLHIAVSLGLSPCAIEPQQNLTRKPFKTTFKN